MVKIILKWSPFIGYESWDSNRIPKDKGVYEFATRPQSGHRIIYVGQTDDLQDRSVQHLDEKEPNLCLKKKLKEKAWDFRYALLPLEADRQDAEQLLYDKYTPECNEVRPTGSGRKIPIEIEEQ
jgi:excinuclease UvrABC nuclease subunit